MSNPASQSSEQPPQLPKGNSSILQGVSENLSFHASPEAFIISRIHELQKQDPSALNDRAPVRAKILNRNVGIISSYRQTQAILGTACEEDEEPQYIASSAYNQFMQQFFPSPNLLLSDGCQHMTMRQVWDQSMRSIHAFSTDHLRTLISSFWMTEVMLDTETDLYELMKTLSWRILLDTFLKLTPEKEGGLFDEFRNLQEDLLRGQFSLMPVSINTILWQSPHSKGIAARKKLQHLIAERLRDLRNEREFAVKGHKGVQNNDGKVTGPLLAMIEQDENMEEVRNHVLMMTSSLAAKALASLLTAFLLNVWFFERGGVKYFDELKFMSQNDQAEQKYRRLRSLYLETERLSPPIVGIMRRLTREAKLDGWNGETDTLLPAGWDAWLYFVGAGRDLAVFGNNCMNFDPLRYMDEGMPEPLGFGAGSKSCLGKNFIRDAVLLTAELYFESRLVATGEVVQPGVRAWLGWDIATPEEWAADMKQLPTQRPTAPVSIRFSK